VEEFPLDTISSISFHKGLLFSSLHVFAANVDEIIIQQCDNNNAGRIIQVWQHILNERNIFQADPANETASDPVTELEKWHSLKEKGIITEDEYNSMKKQISGL
jgi:hypothetical protein